MGNKGLENLVRMAVELDEFDRSAGCLRLFHTPETAIIHPDRRSQFRWFERYAVAAAVAAAMAWAILAPPQPPRPGTAEAASLAIAHWPGVEFDGESRIDCFESQPSEGCAMLAVFRAWHQDCQCLAWQLHVWEDGRPSVELLPQDICDIMIDVTDAPPVEQLLLVAIARDPEDLPRNSAQAGDLLDCLNAVIPPSGPNGHVAAYASAVRLCLPEGVTVVPQSFVVE